MQQDGDAFHRLKMALPAAKGFVLKRLLKLNWPSTSTVNGTVAELDIRVVNEQDGAARVFSLEFLYSG